VVKPFATKNNRNQATVLHHRLIQTIKVNTAKNSPSCYHFSISIVNTAKNSLINKHNKLQASFVERTTLRESKDMSSTE
jgi:hypothetical protein